MFDRFVPLRRRPASVRPAAHPRAARLACVALACAPLGCERDEPAVLASPPVPSVCIGIAPPPVAWSLEPSCDCADAGAPDAGPPEGSAPPAWALRDFQPQSCGFEATYGLEAFRGQVVLLAVLESS